ncbi:Uncharacterized protein DBV15_06726 [Temnothorax longispinosus]|uniref:Uncharacterized protein n=1 Tax=Temnothorax longispinosus TaxID=300112 RepID=A0A4S2JQD4_9HYME|nr:Uncharacterized protein DBV15_06726 [Temnothorax longispinosus]
MKNERKDPSPQHEEKATAANESLSGSNEGKRWRMQQLRESNAEYFRRYLNSASGRGRQRRNRRRRVTDVVSLTLILSARGCTENLRDVFVVAPSPKIFSPSLVSHGIRGYKPRATVGTFVHSDTYSHAMDPATYVVI